MVVLNPAGVPGVLAGLFTLAMAAFVYFSQPSRSQNRRLALVLFFEGVFVGTGVGLLYFMDTPRDAYAAQAVGVTARLILPVLYLWFLATLDTRLVRPLRTRPGFAALAALGVGLQVLWFLEPANFISGVAPVWYAPYEGVRGPWYATFIFVNAAFFFVGLAVAVAAYLEARTDSARRRAKFFILAFGTRDLSYGLFQFVRIVVLQQGDLLTDYLTFLGTPVLWLVYVPLLAYGVLRSQLFDIDVRIKWTVRQGTLAAVFVGLYVVVSEGGQLVLGGAGPYLGIGAAALLLFAIVPLQRMASRVADAAMPQVRDDPAYLNLKKLEVYRAALEHAIASEGTITPREAELLAALRSQLGLSERDHAVLEHAVRTAHRPGGARVPVEPGERILGKYLLLEVLGEGGFGRTLLAEDTVLGRKVVIKVMSSGEPGDPSVLREARAIAAVRHPNVVTLHDVEQVGDQTFIVMEHLDGGSLQQRLEGGRLAPGAFRTVARDVLRALEAVHAAGIVHRDVKPSNILLTKDGRAKLADFGIAHIPGFETTVAGIRDGSAAVGTIRYMSPEQARGHRVTAASDLYSAAATLFEARTGQAFLQPGASESAVELQMRAAAAQAFDRQVEPPALGAWFARALEPAPERRYPSAAAMHEALRKALPAAPRRSRPQAGGAKGSSAEGPGSPAQG